MTKAAPKPEEYFDEAAAKLQAAKTEIDPHDGIALELDHHFFQTLQS